MSADLGSAYGEVIITTVEAIRNLQHLQDQLQQLQQANQATEQAAGMTRQAALQTSRDAGAGMLALGSAIAGAFGLGLKTAADFEHEMSAVQAVSGANAEQMHALGQAALDISANSIYSATQVGGAFEELTKAGVSVQDVLAGAGEAAVVLSHATGEDLGGAALIAANALNQFQLHGSEAMHVADVLTNGANTSAASVDDLGQALKYTGLSAHAMGMDIDTTVIALSAMADQGLRGSSAGVSLNQALIQLAKPTAQARKIWDEWGVSLQDATGNFIGMEALLPQLADHLQGMGDAQRFATLQTLFGVRGARAMLALLATQDETMINAGKGWEDYARNIGIANSAIDQAKTRLDNFEGAKLKFMRSLQALGIVAESAYLTVGKLGFAALTGLIHGLLALPAPVLTIIAGLVGLTGAILTTAGTFLFLLPRILRTIKAFQELKLAMATLRATGGMTGLLGLFSRFGLDPLWWTVEP